MSLRIFYAAGPGNIIAAHENWRQHKDDPTQMSLTYSGQFADACEALDASAYLVSSNPTRLTVTDGRFTLEHRPKLNLGGGGLYHVAEVLYGLRLLATAIAFRADVAVISSGSTHYFVLCLFRLFGIRVVPVLHNTLWPAGRRSRRLQYRLIDWLDGWFFRWFCSGVLGVSAECSRQLAEISLGKPPPFFLVYPQFRREYFRSIPSPPPIERRPVKIVFAGRAEIDKGVFDILDAATALDEQLPGGIEWHICGAGSALEELEAQCEARRLQSIVKIHGWTSPADLRAILGASHLSIVPTRSSFAEGMAKSAIESVLSGRPFVASSVVPALEAFESCSIKVEADDAMGLANAILELIRNPRQYEALVKACALVENPFIDTRCGFTAALEQSITRYVPSAFKAANAGQLRILFAAGPGNIIEAHKFWRRGVPDPGQMSLTFSGEFESFCEDHGFCGYLVAARSPRDRFVDGPFVLEHRPKRPGRGLFFHVAELGYTLRLLATALKFRADYFVVQSGTTHPFLLSMFSALGIKVIPALHNTLWPAGFRPRGLIKRMMLWADGLFFRRCAYAVVCVSPECARQVAEVAGYPVRTLEMRPQFDERLFAPVTPPPHGRPFRLVFAGRIIREKGVFDLLKIVAAIDKRLPDAVELILCGEGPDLPELRSACAAMGLTRLIDIRGHVEPETLRSLMIASHASIIPTRSGFGEGLAMTAVEPILLGRPVISNPVVPAVEILRNAAVCARTDDPASYVDAIVALIQSPERYQQLVSACAVAREQYFDGALSFRGALNQIIVEHLK